MSPEFLQKETGNLPRFPDAQRSQRRRQHRFRPSGCSHHHALSTEETYPQPYFTSLVLQPVLLLPLAGWLPALHADVESLPH